MHLPLPSIADKNARLKSKPFRKHWRLRTGSCLTLLIVGMLAILFFLFKALCFVFASWRRPAVGSPFVVIVTAVNVAESADVIQKLIHNRQDYALRHGYGLYTQYDSDFSDILTDSPKTWARIPAMRAALQHFPNAEYFWYLDQDALIMDPSLTIEKHILEPLDGLMLREFPIAPPSENIKSYRYLKPEDVEIIVTPDDGLSTNSFILKNGDYAKFLLDVWFEPLYRKFGFPKAEMSVLTHIAQWHPTILSKMALIPRRRINAKDSGDDPQARYQPGDFVVTFPGCTLTQSISCEPFLKKYYETLVSPGEETSSKEAADLPPSPPPPPAAAAAQGAVQEEKAPEDNLAGAKEAVDMSDKLVVEDQK